MILTLTPEQSEFLMELGEKGTISLAADARQEATARRLAAAEALRTAGLLRRADAIGTTVRRWDYVLTGAGIVALRRKGQSLGAWIGAQPADDGTASPDRTGDLQSHNLAL